MTQIVVCAPFGNIAGFEFDPKLAPYSEYTKVECPHCRELMWLGSRGRVAVESGQAQMICIKCAVAHGVLKPGTKMERLTDRDS